MSICHWPQFTEQSVYRMSVCRLVSDLDTSMGIAHDERAAGTRSTTWRRVGQTVMGGGGAMGGGGGVRYRHSFHSEVPDQLII